MDDTSNLENGTKVYFWKSLKRGDIIMKKCTTDILIFIGGIHYGVYLGKGMVAEFSD